VAVFPGTIGHLADRYFIKRIGTEGHASSTTAAAPVTFAATDDYVKRRRRPARSPPPPVRSPMTCAARRSSHAAAGRTARRGVSARCETCAPWEEWRRASSPGGADWRDRCALADPDLYVERERARAIAGERKTAERRWRRLMRSVGGAVHRAPAMNEFYAPVDPTSCGGQRAKRRASLRDSQWWKRRVSASLLLLR